MGALTLFIGGESSLICSLSKWRSAEDRFMDVKSSDGEGCAFCLKLAKANHLREF